jgi:hypothetical protein
VFHLITDFIWLQIHAWGNGRNASRHSSTKYSLSSYVNILRFLRVKAGAQLADGMQTVTCLLSMCSTAEKFSWLGMHTCLFILDSYKVFFLRKLCFYTNLQHVPTVKGISLLNESNLGKCVNIFMIYSTCLIFSRNCSGNRKKLASNDLFSEVLIVLL